MRIKLFNSATTAFLGFFEVNTIAEALDAMAVDAGHNSFEESCSEGFYDADELIAEEEQGQAWATNPCGEWIKIIND